MFEALGANAAIRRNYRGETPLMRGVMAMAVAMAGCGGGDAATAAFAKVAALSSRNSVLDATDRCGRTALHHAALSANVKGRILAARACAAAIATAAKNNSHSQSCESLVDAQDQFGDTALHVAVRAGDALLVAILLDDLGASTSVKNKAGLTPRDLGLNTLIRRELPPLSCDAVPEDGVTYSSPDGMDLDIPSTNPLNQSIPTNQSKSVPSTSFHDICKSAISSIESTLATLQTHHKSSQQALLDSINSTKDSMESLTYRISHDRNVNQALLSRVQKIVPLKKRVQKLKTDLRDIRKRNEAVEEGIKELGLIGCVSVQSDTTESGPTASKIDGPKPLATKPSPNKAKRDIWLLQGYIESKEIEEREWMDKISALNNQPTPCEDLCKLVFSSCCQVPLDQVDMLIDPLLEWLQEQDQNNDEDDD
ncbi:transcriptional regulator swi6 [Rhizoclosmatium sp. JEL0117]|nr:transcriptional regulator swi6 [Rhizoclosmatium sp. JEL0117]